jgi:hypothetical protein
MMNDSSTRRLALERAVLDLAAESGFELPFSYPSYLRSDNGEDAAVVIEPKWIQLWHADDVIDLNRTYHLQLWYPGLFGIGSNGAGEVIAPDTRTGPPYPVVMAPSTDLALSVGAAAQFHKGSTVFAA